jgi:hypothetical protein
MEGRKGSERARTPLGMVAVAALVGALVAVPITSLASRLEVKSATGRAISAIIASGVMGTFSDGFHPTAQVNRGLLALSLHRGIGRAVAVSAGSSVAASGSGEIASAKIKIDGVAGKKQGVLVHFEGQMDHDNALGSGCFPSFSVTRNASSTVLATRTQELYGGGTGLELPVSMTFLLTDNTNISPTYRLKLTNPCDSTLFIDGGTFLLETIPLNGATGKAFTGPSARPITRIPRHDR